MPKVTFDHNNPVKDVKINLPIMDAGETKYETLEVENSSQFRLQINTLKFIGDNVTITNPTKEIPPNTVYSFQLKFDAPLDIRNAIKGKFHMEATYIMDG